MVMIERQIFGLRYSSNQERDARFVLVELTKLDDDIPVKD